MKLMLLLLTGLCSLSAALFVHGADNENPVSKAINRHLLSEYGDYQTQERFKTTLNAAFSALESEGGGVLIIPNDVPANFFPENTSQKTYLSPGVTIIDYRKGIEKVYVPPIGTNCSDGFRKGGARIVERHLYENLPPNVDSTTQKYLSHFRGGASSYLQPTENPVKKGKDRKFYVPTLRGLFAGQTLVATMEIRGYGDFELIQIKSLGVDEKGSYFVADAEKDHLEGVLVYNKSNINGMTIDDVNNCDNQSMSLMVNRATYGTGDSFNIMAGLTYQGNIMSAAGDEGAVLFTGEVSHDLNSFRGEVESLNREKRELTYKASNLNCRPGTLGTSRPLINLNPEKHITSGKIIIVAPGHAFMRDKGNSQSLVIGDENTKWDNSIIGRFMAVNEPTEYYDKGESAGPSRVSKERTYRWWHITGLEKRSDGKSNLYMERTLSWTYKDAGPTLFRQENYSWKDHVRPLDYIIAPGAWVSDVRYGISGNVFGNLGRPLESENRRLVLAPTKSDGTKFDFDPGDPVTQPPGPDVELPTGYRIRHFNAYPGLGGGGSYVAINYGRVQVGAALSVSGPAGKLEDIQKKQKDGKPSFASALDVGASTATAIKLTGPVSDYAIDLHQVDGNAKNIRWFNSWGQKNPTLGVNPKTGNFVFSGGNLQLDGCGTVRQAGISATDLPAKNLRGIQVPVKAKAKSLEVKFERQEQDSKYAVLTECSWITMKAVKQRTENGFTVVFENPAPEDGGQIDWFIVR